MSTKYSSLFLRYLVLSGAALLLSACGGGGGGGTSTGSLSLSVTDGPVPEDVTVCVHFTTITLHHTDGDLKEIQYDASTYYDDSKCTNNVDPDLDPDTAMDNAVALSELQGVLSVQIMNSEDVKAGRYTWIRLNVDDSLSYVLDSGGQQALDTQDSVTPEFSCPSCAQSGFKLIKGFTVPAGGEANFVIDIDLARLAQTSSGYTLRPTLRLMDMAQTGTISGSVDSALIPTMISDTDTGCKAYVYAGHDVTPDDTYEGDDVLTTAKVLYDSGSYKYVAGYLPTDSTTDPTPYTVALTCDLDDPYLNENNDPLNPSASDVIFTDGATEGTGQNADVSTQNTTVANFSPVN